jgi:hypothetical protein
MRRRDALGLALWSVPGLAYGQNRRQELPPERERGEFPRVMAHFCTWHRKRPRTATQDELDTWYQASTIPWRNDGSGIGYDSLNPAVLREQCVEMVKYGIVPLASWWGPESQAGDAWLDLWVSEPRPVPAALLYEGQGDGRLRRDRDGWWYLQDPDNTAKLNSELEHLYNKYLSRYPDHFLKVDGRPYILLWPLHAFRGDLTAVLSGCAVRDRLFIAGTAFDGLRLPSDERLPVVAGLDAVTAYNIYKEEIAAEHGGVFTTELVARYRHSALVWQEWLAANLPRTKLILPLTLAYDDRLVPGRNNPTFAATEQTARAVMGEMHQIMSHFTRLGGNVMPWVTMPSYNEHFEGSSLEPNAPWGDLWIRLVHECLTARALPPGV